MNKKRARILTTALLMCMCLGTNCYVRASTTNSVPESDIYVISKEQQMVSRILPDTDISDFKQQFSISANSVHVYDENGNNEITKGKIGTGMKLKFENSSEEYIACVVGDIDGNGELSQVEISKTIKHVVGLEKNQLSGIYLNSADMDGDGEVTQKDVSLMIKYVVYGKLDIGDKKIPSAPIVNIAEGTEGDNNWYKSNVILKVTKPEETPVQIAYTTFEISGTLTSPEMKVPENGKITLTQDGLYEIKLYNVSNIGIKSMAKVISLKINKQVPQSAKLEAKYGDENGKQYEFSNISNQNIYVNAKINQTYLNESVSIEAIGANELPAGTQLPITLENEGTTKLIVTTKNESGLSVTDEYTVIIDKQIKEPGTVITKLNDENGDDYKLDTWTNKNVYVAVQNGGTNITTTFKISGGSTRVEREEPEIITKEGTHIVTIINRDEAGNESQRNITIKIDKTAPEAPAINLVSGEKSNEENEWFKGDVTLKVEQSTKDEGGSGTSYATYEVTGAVTVQESKTNEQQLKIVQEGIYNITAYEYDVAGNKSEGTTITIKIDKTAPQNIQILTSNVTGTTFHVLTSSDENLSGTTKYELYIDGNLYSEVLKNNNSAEFDVVNQSSKVHEIMIKITDVAGNTNSKTIQLNTGRLQTSDIDHIELNVTEFTRTNNGNKVENGADFIISDTSVSDATKFIQVSSSAVQTKGTITGTIKLVRKDGEVVSALEYFPEGLQINVAQYSSGSGTVWQHNASINVLNSTTSNQGKEEGSTYAGSVIVSDKKNSDNTFSVSDEKQKGTKTYTRLIINSISYNQEKLPFIITSNIL